METIRVNMTPCDDVQTIHASQNDNEAREWGFELHNNGEKIDSSSISDQMVFKAYEGGTEQLLPENGSTPTTTPINADIKYPQGLLTNQEFTYRESPTEEDGLANIVDIKGQTIKWNQLAVLTNGGSANGITITNNGDGSLTINGTTTAETNGFATTVPFVSGHVYYVANLPSDIRAYVQLYKNGSWVQNLDMRANPFFKKVTSSADANTIWFSQIIGNGKTFDNVKYYPMVFDLTMMFGETKADEILAMETAQSGSGIAYFKSFFPLDYYPYNSGSLIPFMGNGIKTVGKNLFVPYASGTTKTQNGITGVANADGTITFVGTSTAVFWGIGDSPLFTMLKGTYTISQIGGQDITTTVVDHAKNFPIATVNGGQSRTFTITENTQVHLYNKIASGVTVNDTIKIMLEFGSSASSYEPYTESVINLPISTYFPTGMKDVPDYTNGGKIYDEMTSNKADTRVGSVDLGTLDWTTYSSPERNVFRANILSNMKQPIGTVLPNAMCSKYEPMAYSPISANDDGYFAIGGSRIVIIEHDYTDPVAFKESLSNVYLYYELETETETSFTTASLVTENAEIPLSNEDGVLIGKCTEQLSAEPGFHDAKIKLTDEDGECYSNKIQLHIERSPQ